MLHSLSGADFLPCITQNLNEVYLDHNPFTEIVYELSFCHSQSLFNKTSLSLGWQDYVQSLSTFPGAKKHVEALKVNNLPKHLFYINYIYCYCNYYINL